MKWLKTFGAFLWCSLELGISPVLKRAATAHPMQEGSLLEPVAGISYSFFMRQRKAWSWYLPFSQSPRTVGLLCRERRKCTGKKIQVNDRKSPQLQSMLAACSLWASLVPPLPGMWGECPGTRCRQGLGLWAATVSVHSLSMPGRSVPLCVAGHPTWLCFSRGSFKHNNPDISCGSYGLI